MSAGYLEELRLERGGLGGCRLHAKLYMYYGQKVPRRSDRCRGSAIHQVGSVEGSCGKAMAWHRVRGLYDDGGVGRALNAVLKPMLALTGVSCACAAEAESL